MDLKWFHFESLIYLFIKIRVIKGCRCFTQEQNSKPFNFLYLPYSSSNQDHLQYNLGSGRFIWKHLLDSALPHEGVSKKHSTRTPHGVSVRSSVKDYLISTHTLWEKKTLCQLSGSHMPLIFYWKWVQTKAQGNGFSCLACCHMFVAQLPEKKVFCFMVLVIKIYLFSQSFIVCSDKSTKIPDSIISKIKCEISLSTIMEWHMKITYSLFLFKIHRFYGKFSTSWNNRRFVG